jgi:hypothetical protein
MSLRRTELELREAAARFLWVVVRDRRLQSLA